MPKDNGGPAFPSVCEFLAEPVTWGMTLRDYFAAAALIGMRPGWAEDSGGIKCYVTAAGKYADAMLKERKDAQ